MGRGNLPVRCAFHTNPLLSQTRRPTRSLPPPARSRVARDERRVNGWGNCTHCGFLTRACKKRERDSQVVGAWRAEITRSSRQLFRWDLMCSNIYTPAISAIPRRHPTIECFRAPNTCPEAERLAVQPGRSRWHLDASTISVFNVSLVARRLEANDGATGRSFLANPFRRARSAEGPALRAGRDTRRRLVLA
jgi:hypothetical protein